MASNSMALTHTLQMLTDLCARNASVELHLAGAQGEVRAARVRLLAIEDGQILVDRPDGISQALHLYEGQRIRVYLGQGASRLAFDTVVERRQCLVSLNARQRVPAVALRAPDEMFDAQRRGDFRVSMISSGVLCGVAPAGLDFPYACSLDAPHGAAVIANISARGIGLLLERAPQMQVRSGSRIFMDFQLPEVDDPFCLLGDVRHVRQVREGGSYMVGVRFLGLPTLELTSLWQVLNRFVVEEQRRRLRRRR